MAKESFAQSCSFVSHLDAGIAGLKLAKMKDESTNINYFVLALCMCCTKDEASEEGWRAVVGGAGIKLLDSSFPCDFTL